MGPGDDRRRRPDDAVRTRCEAAVTELEALPVVRPEADRAEPVGVS